MKKTAHLLISCLCLIGLAANAAPILQSGWTTTTSPTAARAALGAAGTNAPVLFSPDLIGQSGNPVFVFLSTTNNGGTGDYWTNAALVVMRLENFATISARPFTAAFVNTNELVGGSDHQNEVGIAIMAGFPFTGNPHRRYWGWHYPSASEYSGMAKDWEMGVNSNHIFILAETPAANLHRIWLEPAWFGYTGHSYYNSEGSGAIRFNMGTTGSDPHDSLGTGGFDFGSGGAGGAQTVVARISGAGVLGVAGTIYESNAQPSLLTMYNPNKGMTNVNLSPTAIPLANGTAAVAGTDYVAPTGSGAALTGVFHQGTAAEFGVLTPKGFLSDSDQFVIEDSDDSDNKKSMSWANIKGALSSDFTGKQTFHRTAKVGHSLGNVTGSIAHTYTTNVFLMTLTGNTAFTFSGGTAPTSGNLETYVFWVTQDGSGSHTLSIEGTSVSVDPTASAVTRITASTVDGGSTWGLDSSYASGSEVNNLESDGAAGIADTEIVIGTGAGTANYAAISGDATLANNGALTIANNSVTLGTKSTRDASTLTNIQNTSIQYPTNVAASATTPAFSLTGGVVYQDLQTNATFQWLPPSGISTTNYQTCVKLVTNSLGSLIHMIAPANCHTQGVWAVTNVTSVTFFNNGSRWTNAIAFPLW
jgi:hypothetical protein